MPDVAAAADEPNLNALIAEVNKAVAAATAASERAWAAALAAERAGNQAAPPPLPYDQQAEREGWMRREALAHAVQMLTAGHGADVLSSAAEYYSFLKNGPVSPEGTRQ